MKVMIYRYFGQHAMTSRIIVVLGVTGNQVLEQQQVQVLRLRKRITGRVSG